MKLCYIDKRLRASQAVFAQKLVGPDYVVLENTENRRKTIVGTEDFRKNYDPIYW